MSLEPAVNLIGQNRERGASLAGRWFAKITGFEELGLVVVLVALALVIGIPNPEFFSTRSLVTILRQSAFIGIIAFGTVYLIAMVEIDLAVGGIYGLSAITGALLIQAGVDPWVSVLVAILAAVALGALDGLLANLLAVPLIIISLGTLSVFRGLGLILSNARPITGMPRSHPFFEIFGGDLLGVPTSVWVLIGVGIILHFVFFRTRFGAIVRAIGSNPAAAEFIGLRVSFYRVATAALVGLLCGVSGVLTLAFFKAADPTLGVGMELQVVAAVVIGGTSLAGGSGSLIGAFIGVLLISIIGSGLVFYGISANWAQFVTGVFILAAIALDRFIKRRRARTAAGK
ncbi:ribose transport system permease protein [Bosea sp. AK1]|uniref:ABC transporter permease n=1 Tax=Bosea sp. AK1 TaxID=2587160 RepID=UPI0011513A4B|nr:ABC transporter permease [Bosea sp. AK1]TQI65331.1 ribose transport system permease protein [Bosea sp. AK1]